MFKAFKKFKDLFLNLSYISKLIVGSLLLCLLMFPIVLVFSLSYSQNANSKAEEISKNKSITEGEVEGLATNAPEQTPSPSPKAKLKTSTIPSPKSTTSAQNTTSNNQSSSNTQSSNNPSPTPTPSPSPSPENLNFEASMQTSGNTVTITANKPLFKCRWVAFTKSGMDIIVSNNDNGDDLISGNTCIIQNNNPSYGFGVKITSTNSEEIILGESPENYW